MLKYLTAGASAVALAACANSTPAPQVSTTQAEAVADVSDEEINELNKLVSVMIDAEELYTEASNIPDDNNWVRNELASLAAERGAQRAMLQERIQLMGGDPDEWGEAVGTSHRIFTQIRTAIDEDSEVAIEEVLRGERYIVDQIGEVLTSSPSQDTTKMLNALRDDVQEDIERLEEIDREA